MTARRYQDLIAWHLADELKRIAEGFSYDEHPQFAYT